MSRHWPLVVIVAAYLILGTLFATRIPAWQMPDEPAHYNYIKQLVQTGRIPVIEAGDWIVGFSPPGPDKRDLDIAPLTYEDHQPPLYYLLGTPAFVLSGGSVVALRLFSVFVGAFTIVFAYFAVLTIFPTHVNIAAFTAAFVGLLPQHVFMMSGINNDSLAEALLALTVWQSMRLIRDGVSLRGVIGLSVLVGFCFWTKATAYLALPVAAFAVWQAARGHSVVNRSTGAQLVLLGIVAGAIGLPWWVHNIQLYGGADFLGLQRHNAVVIGQPTTAEWLAQYGFGGLMSRLLQTTFQSFWGQFGWMSVLLDARIYLALLAVTLISAMAYGLWWLHGQSAKRRLRGQSTTKTGASVYSPWLVLTVAQSRQMQLLAALALMTLLAFVWYNLQFVQHQGRYLYPALIPIGLAFALGWGFLFSRRDVLAGWLWLVVLMGLVALDAYALFRVIVPQMGA